MNISMEAFLNEVLISIEKGIHKITVSNPVDKSNDNIKIVIDEVILKSGKAIRFSSYSKDKVYHENFSNINDTAKKIRELIEFGYKQWDIREYDTGYKVLSNSRGTFSVTGKIKLDITPGPKAHNRIKHYMLKDGEPADILIKLGLMDLSGNVFADKQKKFRQINKFLEILDGLSDNVPQNAHILDFGCGKSYLTFAMYHYFNVIHNKNVFFTGLDIKADVVEHCNNIAVKAGYDKIEFQIGNISDFEHDKKVDMIVTLHACDTATDYALFFAIKNDVTNILSVPCCQHELFSQISNVSFEPLLKHGILRERFTALLTDTVRSLLLESCGYNVNVMEFADISSTAKNIMIKAVKRHEAGGREKLEQYKALADAFKISPVLYRLLEENNGRSI